MVGYWASDIGVQFFVDVAKRRRDFYTFWHGEAQAMRLFDVMVGVLAEQENIRILERRELQGGENILFRREDFMFVPFGFEERLQFGKVGLGQFGVENGQP